ncbi:hypothetical protein KI387_027163, partial [Taxus chinensis]
SESSYESTAHTARFGSCDSREGPSLGLGAAITGAACYCTGTDWGATGVVSAGTGSGTGTATSIGTTAGTGTTIVTTKGTGTGTGTGCTGRVGATAIKSRGTSPSSHGGTGPLYGVRAEAR